MKTRDICNIEEKLISMEQAKSEKPVEASKQRIVDVNRGSTIVFEVLAEGEAYRLVAISSVLESDGWYQDGDRLFLTIPKNALAEAQMVRAVHDAIMKIQHLLKEASIEYEIRILAEDEAEDDEEAAQIFKAKIGLIGDQAVGKTSLVRRYVLDQFDDRYLRTIGAKVSKKVIHLDSSDELLRVDMSIWDVIGKKELAQSSMEKYYKGVQGILAVVDITRKHTLENIQEWISDVSEIAGVVPVYLLINKVDLVAQFAIEKEEVVRISMEIGSPLMFTSAKTGENVEKAFADLAKHITTKHTSIPKKATRATS
jgi:small GTP-binding protein